MKKFLLLAKALRKMGGSTENESARSDVGDSMVIVKIVLGIALTVGCFFASRFLADLSFLLGGVKPVFGLLFFVVSCLVTVLSFMDLLSTLYMSTDLPALLCLPFNPRQIAFARTFNSCRMFFFLSTAAVLPFGIGFGIRTGTLSAAYWIGLVLADVCMPLVCVCLAGTVVILIMSLFRLFRSRDALKVIGAVLGTALALVFIFVKTDPAADSQAVTNAVADVTQALSGYIAFFPELPLITDFMSGGSVLLIPAALAVTAAFAGVFVLVSGKMYLSSALKMQDTAAGKKSLSRGEMDKSCRGRSVSAAYMLKDVRCMLRDPAFMSNGWLPTLIWPLFLLSGFLGSGDTNIFALAQGFLEKPDTRTLAMFCIATGVALIAGTSVAGMSGIPGCTVSREGAGFYYMKILPVPFLKQIRAKRNAALCIFSVGGVAYVILGAATAVIAGILSVPMALYGVLISVLCLFTVTNLLAAMDVRKPNLNWENVAAIAKPKAVGIVLMIVFLILGILFAAIGPVLLLAFFTETVTAHAWVLPACGLVLFALLAFLSDFLLTAAAGKLEKEY